MPITHTIDEAARVVRFRVGGVVDAEEMVAAIDAAEKSLGTRTGFRVLSDHRGLEVPARRDQLEVLVRRLSREGSAFRGARCAIIVASKASYGMMRMLSVMVDRIPITLEVFEDPGEAEQWLVHSSSAAGPTE